MFTAPGLPGTFRLQLFTAAGARPVEAATQIAGEEGIGLMNGAERFADAVWERHCPAENQPPVWVERQLWPEGSRQETRFWRVVFAGAVGAVATVPGLAFRGLLVGFLSPSVHCRVRGDGAASDLRILSA
ncbi:hypothetical protein ACFUNF_19240 [Streptomyces sp. NPDC057291]|uniref:hypothetical protein n=1 Tax=Streptomyces sp. NPDC057291 TaxID=3346087 RepID=UPI003635650C